MPPVRPLETEFSCWEEIDCSLQNHRKETIFVKEETSSLRKTTNCDSEIIHTMQMMMRKIVLRRNMVLQNYPKETVIDLFSRHV